MEAQEKPEQSASASKPTSPNAPKREESRKRRRHWPWIMAGVILVLCAIGFGVYRRHTKTKPTGGKSNAGPPTLMISTATATNGDIPVYVNALGAVTPVYTVAVKSRVDGQL